MRSPFILCALLLLLSFTSGEEVTYPQDYFAHPVNGPLRLSGTFGELRPGHFHGGIDIKGRVGDALFAVAEGYVSRILVAPDGYGKAIYLSHPNGYTTVYAHLDHFSPELEAYVQSHQHAAESYAVDLRPETGQFTVEKGAVIGAIGLTGSSLGPHLHFEVRDDKEALVINPLHFGLPVADSRPPTMQRLRLYGIDEKGGAVFQQEAQLQRKRAGAFGLTQGDTLYTDAPQSALGLDVFDQQDAAANRNGIYDLRLFYDDALAYHFYMEHFRRKETRYLSAHIDYTALRQDGNYFNRTYRMPGNALSIYQQEEGIITLQLEEAVKVRLEARDIASNASELAFWLKRTTKKKGKQSLFYNYQLPYDAPSIIHTPTLSLHFPDSSLYENLNFFYEPVLEDSYGVYSLVHTIHQPATPVHRSFQIGIRPTLMIPDHLRDKAFIAYCSSSGAVINCGGQWKDGFLQTRARSFGSYCILTDDEPPTIEPLNWRGNMARAASMAFRIRDNYKAAGNISGLQYRGTIDGRWALFEYDAKRGRLEYFFDNTLTSGEHQLRLEVKDAMGNVEVFERQFSRK